MNAHLKQFLHRGMLFGGFGPLVTGIVYLSLSLSGENMLLSCREAFVAIFSTYLLAFVHAGGSVMYQIERLPLALGTLLHLSLLYASYTACYLLNAWISFDGRVLLIYTGIFLAVYLLTWLTVFLSVRVASRRLNARLSNL